MSALSTAIIADGPVAFYRLGDTSTSVASDSSGNSRSGTYVTSGTRTNSLVPGDADQATSGVRVSIAHASWQAPLTAITVTALINISASGLYAIAGKTDAGTFGENGAGSYRLFISDGTLYWQVFDASFNPMFTVSAAGAGGAIRHIAGTWDGTTARLFIDGTQVGSTAASGTMSSSTVPLQIGSMGGNFNVSGVIDEVAFYNKALTPARIKTHSNLSKGITLSVVGSVTGTGTPDSTTGFPAGVQEGDLAVLVAGTQGTLTMSGAAGWTNHYLNENMSGSGYYGSSGSLFSRSITAAMISANKPAEGLTGGDASHTAFVVMFLRDADGPMAAGAASKTLYGRPATATVPATTGRTIVAFANTTVGSHTAATFPNSPLDLAQKTQGYAQVVMAAFGASQPATDVSINDDSEKGSFALQLTTAVPPPTYDPTGSAYADAVLADNPRAFYRFTEASGTQATDSTVNARHGTLVNGPVRQAAGPATGSKALAFTRASQQTVALPAGVLASGAGKPYTIEFWYNIATADSSQGFLWIGSNAATGAGNDITSIRMDSATAMYNYWWGNDALASPLVSRLSQWVHVAWIYNGTSRRCFINGVEQNSSIINSAALNIAAAGVGRLGRSANSEYLDGQMAEVAFFDKALTPKRIAEHYAAAVPEPTNPTGSTYVENFDTSPTGSGDNPAITATSQSASWSGRPNGGQYAFDGNLSNSYISGGGDAATFWFQAQYASAWTMRSYTVVSSPGWSGRVPAAWKLQGSNDGSVWTDVDTRSGQGFTEGQSKSYVIATSGSYSYYRFQAVTAGPAGAGDYGEIMELFTYSTTTAPAVRLATNGGTWSYDSTAKALQQTDGSQNAKYAYMASMPRSAANFIDVTVDVTLLTDPAGRRHCGVFLQAVDGAAGTGIRLVALDTTWRVDAFTDSNGPNITIVNMQAPLWSPGETKKMRVRIDSSGKGTWWVDGGKVATWVDTTFTRFRPGFFSWGSTARYDNLSYQDGFDLTTKQITNLVALPFNTGVSVSWDAVPGAGGYDWRINGGAITSTTATRFVATGLTNGTPVTIEVRATSSGGGNTPWKSVVTTPVQTLMFDNFDRADVAPSTTALGTSTDGKTWQQQSSLGIVNGLLYATSQAENLAWVAGTYDVDITIVLAHAQTSSPDLSPIWRFRDVNNYWFVQFYNNGVWLYRRQGGSFNGLLNLTTQVPWAQNQPNPMTLRILAIGTSVQIFVNGVFRLAFEDTLSVPATDTGVGIRDANANGRADLFSALTPATPNPTASYVYKGRDTRALDTVGAA